MAFGLGLHGEGLGGPVFGVLLLLSRIAAMCRDNPSFLGYWMRTKVEAWVLREISQRTLEKKGPSILLCNSIHITHSFTQNLVSSRCNKQRRICSTPWHDVCVWGKVLSGRDLLTNPGPLPRPNESNKISRQRQRNDPRQTDCMLEYQY